MFAPKVAKSQTKKAESLTSKPVLQRSAFGVRQLGHDPVEEMLLLQRTIGNQATLRLLAQRTKGVSANGPVGDKVHAAEENTAAGKPPRGFSWDFSKIPVFGPARADQSPGRFPLPLPPSSSAGTPAVAEAIHQATVENRTTAPPTQAAFSAATARVRMRDDARADRSAHLLRAQAVAFGDQVLFRSGRYAPNTERGRALIAHELTHLAHQNQTGRPTPQRSVAGDVLSVTVTQAMAEAMTNDELYEQIQLLRAHLQSAPNDLGAAENLAVLENVVYVRQGTAQQTSPPAPLSAPTPAATTPDQSTSAPQQAPAFGPSVAEVFQQLQVGGNQPITIVSLSEAEYQAMTGTPASSLPEGSLPAAPVQSSEASSLLPGWASGVPGSIGAASLFVPKPNWYYRVLSPTDPSLSQIFAGADLLPRPPDPGFTFQPAANPAEMTFRHLRPGGNVPQVGTNRISTAGDLKAFETVLKDRGTGELARVDVNAARRLGAEFLEHGPIVQHLEQVERDLLAQLNAARASGRGKNAIAALERRLGALQKAREYARIFQEGQGVGRIPSGAITEVQGAPLSRAVAGERAFLGGLKFFRYGGRVLLVVGVGTSVYRVASVPSGETGRVATQEAGGWAFSLGGAAVGAKLGAVGGAALGWETGPGAIVATAIGSLIGAAIGFAGGEAAAEKLYDIGESGLNLLGDTPRLIETTTLMFGSDEDRRRYYELREIETGEPLPWSSF